MSFSSREGRGTVKFGGDLVLIVREKESGKWGSKIERERGASLRIHIQLMQLIGLRRE